MRSPSRVTDTACIERCDAEIQDLHHLAAVCVVHHEQIRGLQIAVNDPLHVRCCEPVANLEHPSDHAADVHGVEVSHQAAELHAAKQLEHHEGQRRLSWLGGDASIE